MIAARGFLISAIVLAVMSPLARNWPRGAFDFQLHNTYFVVAPGLVLIAMALLAGLFALLYYFVPMSPRVSKIHFWLTATALFAFWISFYVFERLMVRVTSSHAEIPGAVSAMAVFVVSAALLAASPVIFAFNFAVVLLSRSGIAR